MYAILDGGKLIYNTEGRFHIYESRRAANIALKTKIDLTKTPNAEIVVVKVVL